MVQGGPLLGEGLKWNAAHHSLFPDKKNILYPLDPAGDTKISQPRKLAQKTQEPDIPKEKVSTEAQLKIKP